MDTPQSIYQNFSKKYFKNAQFSGGAIWILLSIAIFVEKPMVKTSIQIYRARHPVADGKLDQAYSVFKGSHVIGIGNQAYL